MKIMIFRVLLFLAGLILIEAFIYAVKGLIFYSTYENEDNIKAKLCLKRARRFAYAGVLLLIVTLIYIIVI